MKNRNGLQHYRKRFIKNKNKKDQFLRRREKVNLNDQFAEEFNCCLSDYLQLHTCSNQSYFFIPKKALLQLKTFLKKNQQSIEIQHIAILLEKLARIEERGSMYLIESIVMLIFNHLDRCLEVSCRDAVSTAKNIAILVKALPTLSICHKDYAKLYEKIFSKCLFISDITNFSMRDKSTILNGIAKMSINLSAHKTLIDRMLEPFFKRTPRNGFILRNLWEFLLYAKIHHYKRSVFYPLYQKIWRNINICTSVEPTVSYSQRKIFNLIEKNLKQKYGKELKLEHQKGPYLLDIALTTQKINIEIDGSHHSRLSSLTLNDKLRDEILTKCGKWKVFRLPLSFFNRNGYNKRLNFESILSKLDDSSYLFKQ